MSSIDNPDHLSVKVFATLNLCFCNWRVLNLDYDSTRCLHIRYMLLSGPSIYVHYFLLFDWKCIFPVSVPIRL